MLNIVELTSNLHWTSALTIATGILAIGYGLACVVLFVIQTSLIFHPYPDLAHTPAEFGMEFRDVWIPVGATSSPKALNAPNSREQSAGRLHAWWIGRGTDLDPQAHRDRVTIYFHGNLGNIGSKLNLERIAAFHHTWGGTFLIVDYRGYGQSIEGPPSEVKLYEDLDAVWHYLTRTEQIAPDRITVYGHSLGGAAAIHFATQHPEIRAAIVDGSFTSIAQVAQNSPFLRLFPVSRILRHRFTSIEKVATLAVPTLFIHGTTDTVVPTFMSEELYAATPATKELHLLPDVGHQDVMDVASEEFLTRLSVFLERVDREAHAPHI